VGVRDGGRQTGGGRCTRRWRWRLGREGCNTSLFVDQIKTLVGCFILGEWKTFAKYCACVLSCVISCECMCMILCVCVTYGTN
jgi:hypothetical protein